MKMKTLSLLLVVGAFAFAGTAKARKPNVLFFMSDDLNTALSGFGHPQCKTPELDKLAGRGMRLYHQIATASRSTSSSRP